MGKGAPSLTDFVRDRRLEQKRANCPVCQLPDDVQEQIHRASERKIRRTEVLAWLNATLGHPIKDVDLTAHYNARHQGE